MTCSGFFSGARGPTLTVVGFGSAIGKLPVMDGCGFEACWSWRIALHGQFGAGQYQMVLTFCINATSVPASTSRIFI
jgi:hypothetical protein